ncbi:hypothetical protein AB0D62_21025 [Streptomyces massasporeus]|uniref:hypothetical protein n=1 Tax=Streptomyces massasporeus TaxID=67324 RepID=UPI0033FAB283
MGASSAGAARAGLLTAAPPVTTPGKTALNPTADRHLAEQAVVTGALQGEEPERFVRIDIPQPDGLLQYLDRRRRAARRHIDGIALAAGLDAWSWIEILDHHLRLTHRGRIEIRTHPLRPA